MAAQYASAVALRALAVAIAPYGSNRISSRNSEITDMRLTHPRRLAKLAAVFTIDDRIPIYVKYEKDLAIRIEELIAAGALAEADRPRCVFYLDCRPAYQWRSSTDEAAVRLKAQSAIRTPCATWLPKENHVDASASACSGDVDAGSPTRTSANQISQAEQTAPDGGTTGAC